MHITFTTTEKARLESFNLALEDIAVECNDNGKPIFIYKIVDNKLVMTKDIEDHDRQLSDEELENLPMPTKEETRDWWINNTSEGMQYRKYQLYTNAMYHHFKLIYHSGYYPQTDQTCFQIACDQNFSVKDHVEELDWFVPHIKPLLMNDEKYKQINILEETCSENGCYYILIFEDHVRLTTSRYHNESIVKKFNNLEETVKYVIKHHPYRRKK